MPTIQGLPATMPELLTSKALDKLRVSYQFQKSFLGGRTTTGGLVADFYLPGYSMVISILGTYWHSTPEVRARDIVQKLALANDGTATIFILEVDIMRNASYYIIEALRGISHAGIKI